MVICQGIEHGLSFPTALDQAGLFEHPQLMGNGGNGHIQTLSKVTNADLFLKKHVENLDAGGIPKDLKEIRKVKKIIFRGKLQ